jgi:hypothetical protein
MTDIFGYSELIVITYEPVLPQLWGKKTANFGNVNLFLNLVNPNGTPYPLQNEQHFVPPVYKLTDPTLDPTLDPTMPRVRGYEPAIVTWESTPTNPAPISSSSISVRAIAGSILLPEATFARWRYNIYNVANNPIHVDGWRRHCPAGIIGLGGTLGALQCPPPLNPSPFVTYIYGVPRLPDFGWINWYGDTNPYVTSTVTIGDLNYYPIMVGEWFSYDNPRTTLMGVSLVMNQTIINESFIINPPPRAVSNKKSTAYYQKSIKYKPKATDFFTGYYLDSLPVEVATTVNFTATTAGELSLEWYEENKLETVGCRSFDRHHRKYRFFAGQSTSIEITGLLGSLQVGGSAASDFKTALAANPATSGRPAAWLLSDKLTDLYNYWIALYNAHNPPVAPPPDGWTLSTTRNLPITWTITQIGATNSWRGQNGHNILDANTGLLVPLPPSQVAALYSNPQPDGTIGDYMADSPRLKEIHETLNAGVTSAQTTTVAWQIDRLLKLLGGRYLPTGEPDWGAIDAHKRQHWQTASAAAGTYGVGSWGSAGMALPVAVDRFVGDGQIAEGGGAAIHDLPQLLLELIEQLMTALGTKELGAIDINGDRFTNLPSLLTGIYTQNRENNRLLQSSLVSSIATQEMTKELIVATGARLIIKSIATIEGTQIPYLAIDPSWSHNANYGQILTNIRL